MEDFSKIREQQNRSMSFEEYNNKNADKVKEKKFRKTMKSVLLYPVKFVGAIFGITKESLMSSSSSGHGGGYHAPNAWKESQRVDHTPTPPSYDDIVRKEIAIHQYMKDTDGIPNDHQQGR